MFRSSIRIPLRRFLHTTPPRPPPSQGNNYALVFGIGAMVAAVTYMSNPGSQRITLDANPIAALKHASVPSTASAETRTDILSSTKSTSLHSPEPATNETAPLNIDPEGGEPPEGADDDSS
ncbi:hypothetical protein PILCRDRAFT_688245 [Piloderma croceum F 1598]|uniref:Uncharacterized protein n=1 Tax=Piloderma croceum (strain F 1598) TaxID=765440 RepID=A0A0C3AMK1_PILCF|nr:hypothetical protein PILCRDRAFT_688245 [Piloderma croceum F 1598]